MSVAPLEPVAETFLRVSSRLAAKPAVVRGGRAARFGDIAEAAQRFSEGIRAAGLQPGERVALLVPPSEDLYALTFGLYLAGLVPVFIDPGIGFLNMGRCLCETEPAAFVGSPKAHLARLWGRWAPTARLFLSADGKFPGAPHWRSLRGKVRIEPVDCESSAAVLFTSGSTGAPKGAVYTHAMFASQLESLRGLFDIQEGEVSVPTFPLFGLFDAALGQTCIIPEMDFTRPGSADPARLVALLQGRGAHQLFGSPALLDGLGRFGRRHGIALPGLRRVLSAGAPVSAKILESVQAMLAPGVQVHTPYGATEALPAAVMGSLEILAETAGLSAQGRGVCVGRPVDGTEVALIAITDGPVASWNESLKVRGGEVGEIAVKGPMVSREYFHRPQETALAKIPDGTGFWHRMGDLGRIDEKGRLWFLGRKSHRVRTKDGELYTTQVEGVFNAHPDIKRTALVSVGRRAVLCVEKERSCGKTDEDLTRELLGLGEKYPHTRPIATILFHPNFPVDIRHNAKIFREKLSVWAAGRLK